MSKKREWFGVKTLYRVTPVGRPQGKDRYYSNSVTLVEERVVVVKAGDASEAMRLAERDAHKYARMSHRNPYGQRVQVRVLGFVDAYTLDDDLHELTEVFSETEVVPRSVRDRAIIRRQLGRHESNLIHGTRRNFLDLVFMGTAPGVKPTRREFAERRKLDASLAKPSKRQ